MTRSSRRLAASTLPLAALWAGTCVAAGEASLEVSGGTGPGAGKRVVLVSGVEECRSEPMMPIARTGTYAVEGGPRGRVFTTTMGSSTDLASEGLRCLPVNAFSWACGLEAQIPEQAVVDVVGSFEPTPFGFDKAKPGLEPAELG